MPPPDSAEQPDAPGGPPPRGRWIGVAQALCGVSLLGVLAWQAARADGFERLTAEAVRPAPLAVSLALLTFAVVMSFLRWRMVALAAGVPMTVFEALRFGAIGFALNFVALGNIGGDVVKATLLAHGRPGRRTVAVTTILVDRVMGLFALLLFASGAILVTGAATAEESPTAVRLLCRATLAAAAAGVVGVGVALAPGRFAQRIVGALAAAPPLRSWPVAQRAAETITEVCDLYHRGIGWLAAALALGMLCDVVYVGSFYLVATALPLGAPGFVSHFFIVPLGLMAGAIPVSPSGLGTTEAAVDLLYRSIGDGSLRGVRTGDGALVTFAHRLLTMAVGGVAVVGYLAMRGRGGESVAASSTTAPE